MNERFNSFNNYLQGLFKERVQRISLDAGFGCPNIDGSRSDQGCVYCNNKAFGVYAASNKAIDEQIAESIEFYKKRSGVNKFIAYFQSFAGTYNDPEKLRQKYNAIRRFPEIVGLFISTRPDCIDEEKIKLISEFKNKYLVWIEYGLQTTHNHILESINRNHTYEDFLAAYDLTRKYDLNVGVHLILGLPGATYEDMLEDAKRLAGLDIQGIKFHILHIVKGARLLDAHQRGEVKLFSRVEYTKTICDFLERIPASFVILRLVSDARKDYLVAPGWINDKHKALDCIRKELEARGVYQGHQLRIKNAK